MKNIPAKILPKVIAAILILLGLIMAYAKKNEHKMIYKAHFSKIEKAKDTSPPKRYQAVDKE